MDCAPTLWPGAAYCTRCAKKTGHFDPGQDGIKVMTLHMSKGLECSVVVMVRPTFTQELPHFRRRVDFARFRPIRPTLGGCTAISAKIFPLTARRG